MQKLLLSQGTKKALRRGDMVFHRTIFKFIFYFEYLNIGWDLELSKKSNSAWWIRMISEMNINGTLLKRHKN